MKGYKAFQKGMICRGKQYAENTIYEEQGADSCCKEGVMHYCETPFDVWSYYPVVDDNGDFTEYAEIEPLTDVLKDENKCATKKLRIGNRLSLEDFIKAQIGVVSRRIEMPKKYNASSSDKSRLSSSGVESQLASSGDGSQLASSGDGSKLASSGYGSQLASSGEESQLAVMGSNSIGASVGVNSKAKGIIGNWIVLAEWKCEDGAMYPVCVKAAKIDGEIIKADTWYTLKNGEFVEAM